MILIGLFPLFWFFFGLYEQDAEHRVCEPMSLNSLDWEEFKWLYKQQDSTYSADSVASYVFIRVNPDGTRETQEIEQLHQPWTELLQRSSDRRAWSHAAARRAAECRTTARAALRANHPAARPATVDRAHRSGLR